MKGTCRPARPTVARQSHHKRCNDNPGKSLGSVLFKVALNRWCSLPIKLDTAASRLGVSREMVWKWCAGWHTPTARNLLAIEEWFGISTRAWFVEFRDPGFGAGCHISTAIREREADGRSG